MALVEQRDREVVPLNAACAALSVSRASLYRSRRPPSASTVSRVRAPSPRRLDVVERQRLLDTLHRAEFADQPPTEVYATMLGRGEYIASIRTMYRVLAEAGETGERRHQRAPQAYAKPSLTATAPNQVWTWDITKLATQQKGVFLMAYVIIDLFSRYVVGWMLAAKECKQQFKTMKYQPDYPGRFASELQGRGWLQGFFGWHNDQHHHSSLALFTPADVFLGRVETVRATRQSALDAAYAEHPERFPHGPPRAPLPPDAVHINPIVADALSIPTATSDNASSTTSDYDDARASCEPQRPPATCLAALPSPPLSGALAT